MHIHFLFLIFMIIHSINSIAMEVIHNQPTHTSNKVPPLYDICLEQIATGFGNDKNECYKNSLQNLATLHKIRREGKYKQYPYGIGSDEIKKIETKIFPDHDDEYIQTYARKVYQNVSTPFMVKHDNDSFYIQDDRTNIALLNIKTGEKQIVFKGTSFIRCCTKNKSTDHVYIGTSDGKVYALKTNIYHNTHKEKVFSTECHNSPITSVATENNYISCSSMDGHTYLIDLEKNNEWIHQNYQYFLSVTKRSLVINKALNNYRWNFFRPRIIREKLPYTINTIGNNTEWIYNKVLEPFSLDEDISVSHPYPFTSWDNENEYIYSNAIRNNIAYAGTNHGNINLLDIRSSESIDLLKRHNSRVSCLITSKHNDHIFYSGCSDGFIIQHDLRKLSPIQSLRTVEPQKNGVTCMYESNDGKTIYSGGPSNGIRMYDFSTGQYDPYKNKKIRSAHAIINGETKKVSLQYVDCITANDDESELYISNVPTGITVLSPHYGLEEFVDDIKVAEQQEK